MESFGDRFRRHVHRSVSERHIRSELHRQNAQATHAQSVETTFDSDTDPPSGLMRVLETSDYKAEINYLRKPDTGEPFDSPWHSKVIGPDPLAGGSIRPVWSQSFDGLDAAVGTTTQRLRKDQRRFDRRSDMNIEQQTAGTGEVVGYAIYDPDVGEFVRSGFFGQMIYPTREGATESAEGDEYVVEVTRVEKENIRP